MADDTSGNHSSVSQHPLYRARRDPETIDATATDVTPSSAKPGSLPADDRPPESVEPPTVAAAAMESPSLADEPARPHLSAAPAATAEATPRRSSLLPLAAAIVVGALIAVAGAFGLHQLDQSAPAADPRVAALSAKVDALAGRDPAATLATRIDALDRKLAETLPRGALAPLEKRLDGVETAQRAAAAQSAAALQSATAANAGTAPAVAPPSAAPPPAAPPVDLGPLEARVAQIEQKLGALDAAINAPKTAARAAEDPQATAAARAAEAAPAVAILTQSLILNLMRGTPFAEQVRALDALGADKTKLDILRPVATAGLPNNRKLAADLEPLIAPILTAETKPAEGSVWDRLAAGASRLVRVRKVGESGEGSDAGATIARLKTAVLRGELDQAVPLWNELPPDAKAKSQAWGATLKTSATARKAARQLEAEAIAALAKAKS